MFTWFSYQPQYASCCLFEAVSFVLQPYGFDVGQSEKGNVLKGLDLGVVGMRAGGQVRFWKVAFWV